MFQTQFNLQTICFYEVFFYEVFRTTFYLAKEHVFNINTLDQLVVLINKPTLFLLARSSGCVGSVYPRLARCEVWVSWEKGHRQVRVWTQMFFFVLLFVDFYTLWKSLSTRTLMDGVVPCVAISPSTDRKLSFLW